MENRLLGRIILLGGLIWFSLCIFFPQFSVNSGMLRHWYPAKLLQRWENKLSSMEHLDHMHPELEVGIQLGTFQRKWLLLNQIKDMFTSATDQKGSFPPDSSIYSCITCCLCRANKITKAMEGMPAKIEKYYQVSCDVTFSSRKFSSPFVMWWQEMADRRPKKDILYMFKRAEDLSGGKGGRR